MKKFFIMGICFCLLLTSCGKSDNKEETTSTNAVTECTTVTETTTEIITEATTQNNITLKKDKLILDNGKYRYEIEKTDFEEAYPEELLLQFASMLSMNFGVEDYYDWNTTGENVFVDVRHCCLSMNNFIKKKSLFDYDNSQDICQKLMDDAQLEELRGVETFTFSLHEYNDYLKDLFGPDVIQLEISDFETAKSAKEKGLPLSGDISEGDYRCFYSGVDDIVLVQCCPTDFASYGEYVYDIREKEGNYSVYTIGSFEMIEYEETLKKYQQNMLEELNRNIRKFMQTKVYKFGCNDDGDVYLKSVDKKYLIADNAEYNFIIESDKPVEVENKKASTEEYKIIDKLPAGTKILVGSKWERIGWTEIITEDYLGFVETKYIKEIAG